MYLKRTMIGWIILGIALATVGLALVQTMAVSAAPLATGELRSMPKGPALRGEMMAPAQTAPAEAAAAELSAAQASTCSQWHTVQAGETLYKIGLRYNLTWRRLADLNNLANPNLIYTGSRLCVKADGTTTPPTNNPGGRIPTFSIVEVVKGQSVTIKTSNFPANDRFDVLMGAFGTRGVNGTRVTQVNSGQGGSITATFDIPAGLKDHSRIAIRLQSPTSGYYSYNWFYNNTTP